MSELIFTRCPHCSTLFRLTPQQLNAAKGAVRCGKCFQVFNAMQHVVDAATLQASGKTIPMPEKKSLELDNPLPDTSTAGITPFSSIELPPASEPESAPAPRVSDNIFASDSAFSIEEDPLFAAEPKKKPKVQDDAWAEALLRELDGETAPAPKEPDYTSSATRLDFIQNEGDDYFGAANEARNATVKDLEEDLSESFRSLTGSSFGATHKNLTLPDLDIDETNADADESWAQAMLKELENEHKNQPGELSLIPSEKEKEKEKESAARKASAEKRGAKKASIKDELDNFDFDALFQEEMGKLAAPPADPIVAAPVQKDNLFDFQPAEPLPATEPFGSASEMEFSPPAPREKKSGGRQWLWGLLSLLVILALFVEYLYFNFDTKSRDIAWRPWYEKACQVFKCTLPPLVDTSQIRSRNMTLSERNGSYIVDFLVKNHASFAQPFPNLELRFSNINGKVVARRLFKPAEYVRGELTGAKLMPAGVDIRFSIEVVKPAPDAVNFDLNFYPATE